MLFIHLHNVQFYSYHGVHDEEKVLGGKFEVNITVRYQPKSTPVKTLADTINYVSIYSLLKKRMDEPTELLETVATEVAAEIIQQFALAEEVDISITKLHPPIVAFQGAVGVSCNIKRSEIL
jgi:dihydroneopterin aldolase